jgi:hypothetical protein
VCACKPFSWDIVIEKVQGQVFLDKRPDSTLDLLTVSESAHDPPSAADDQDAINHPDKLSLEATMINQSFSQQVLMEVDGVRKTVSQAVRSLYVRAACLLSDHCVGVSKFLIACWFVVPASNAALLSLLSTSSRATPSRRTWSPAWRPPLWRTSTACSAWAPSAWWPAARCTAGSTRKVRRQRLRGGVVVSRL